MQSTATGFRVAVLLASIIFVQGHQGPNAARYDNYRLYRVTFGNEQQVAAFAELDRLSDSCYFLGHARFVGQELSILVAAHKVADFAELLQRYAVEHRILNHNFQDAIDDQFRSVQPRSTPGRSLDWQHYHHLDTIYAWLDHLHATHPQIVRPLTFGRSFHDRELRGVQLSFGGANRPTVFVEAGIHAREWIAPATATFLIDRLLNSPNATVRHLATTFDWIFLPVLNADGYAHTFDSDRMWRKTRQLNGVCFGTDLNRNFDAHWRTVGASADPCADDFAGPEVFSEPEARQLAEWLRAHRNESRIAAYMTLHSFSQLVLFPNSHSAERVPNYAALAAIGRSGVEAIARRSGVAYRTGAAFETIYPSSGGSMDWAYGALGVPMAFTFELRGGPESEVMFNLPAAEIEPVGEEILDAFIAMFAEANELGVFE